MIERFNPPTRNQLERIVSGDQRLLHAFEQIFEIGGQDVSTLQGDIYDLTIRVDSNEVDIAENAARIKTNEVLLWLSM